MNKKGFTLIELLSTIFVLGIVLTIAISSTVGIFNTLKRKALDEKIAIIEESAILFGENRKENIVKSTSIYNDSPCKSFKLRELVPKYIENDTDSECINSENGKETGCIVDPSDKNNYLDETEVIIYYKNKRIYSVVDINDELECENTNLTPVINEFYLEDGKTTTVSKTNVSAYLSWDAENIKYYCILEENNVEKCVWNSVSSKLVLTDYTLSSGDGKKTVYAYIKDKYENLSEGKRYEITLDATAPKNNSVKINNDASYTTSTNVTLTLSSSGAKKMCISNTTSCSNWEDYTTSKSHTLTSGDGTKTVYVWYKDELGNTSEYVSDTITIDTSAPTNNSVKINNDAAYTTSTSVTLTLSSTGASEMCISNTSSCTNWVTYATSKSHTLTSGDGTKTVYVWYKDAAGNIISNYVTDTINLDASAPTNNSVKINSNAAYTTSTSVTLTLSSTGATQMCISNTTSCTNWITYATSKSWTLNNSTNGTKTVYVWYRDEYGNTTSTYVSDTINLDTVAPTSNSVRINNNATYTTSTSVTLTLSSTGASQMCISNTTSCSNWVTYATSKSHTLTSGNGTKTVYVWYRDAAGNQTSYVTDTITLDTQAPTSNSVSINSGATSTNSTSVTLTLSSTGASQMCISNTSSCSSWETYATSKSWTLATGDGTKTVYVWYRDVAGNTTSYVTDTITLSTAKPFGQYLVDNKVSGLNTTAVWELYRYSGSSVNNYVSLSGVLYRIVGIVSADNTSLGLEKYQVKLVKASPLSARTMSSNTSSTLYWESTAMYTYLQSTSVLNNSSVIPSAWVNKIDSVKWYTGLNGGVNSSQSYSVESSRISSNYAKVGLIYCHDLDVFIQGINIDWMYKTGWTMTLSGRVDWTGEGVQNHAWARQYEEIGGYDLTSSIGVSPTFFLIKNVVYKSGSGTSSNPYIVE